MRDSVYLAVLLGIRGLHTLPRQLPPLAHRHERSAEPQRKNRAEQEPARVEADDDIDAALAREHALREMGVEMGEEGLDRRRLLEEREDVEEGDALLVVYHTWSDKRIQLSLVI